MVLGIALVLGALAVVVVAVMVRERASGGELSDTLRERVAIVEVDGDEDQAGELCRRALLEVNETRTTKRVRNHRLRVTTDLDGAGPGTQTMRFELAPDGEGHTQIRVVARAGGADGARLTQTRMSLLDRVAAWLAQHGDGRVVDVDWGRLTG
jgi:hypothetical protein